MRSAALADAGHRPACASSADAPSARSVRRLNWGCGPNPVPGWVNSDRLAAPGVELIADIRAGLPVADDTFDYATSVHALQDIPCLQLVPALRELRRVLKDRGWLRLVLPDLDRAICAYVRGDREYFLIPDEEAETLGGKLNMQLTWYGGSRSLLTAPYAEELLLKAGFSAVHHASFRETGAPYPGITALDNRPKESFFIEAVK
jgi:predicted SAM-dependent methyltransferase